MLIALALAPGRTNPPAEPQPVKPEVLTRLPVRRRLVAITFDACQTRRPAGYDARIVQTLRATHTSATFALCGSWVATHASIARDLASEPLFEIANHSYLHPHMTRVGPDRARAEIVRTQEVILRIMGRRARLFRPPYGEYDDRLVRLAASLGLRTLLWDVVTGDPDPHVSAAAMTREVLRRVRPGSIVIMHVNGRGRHTAEALPNILAGLRRRGYGFATVSDLLAAKRSDRPVERSNLRRIDQSPARSFAAASEQGCQTARGPFRGRRRSGSAWSIRSTSATGMTTAMYTTAIARPRRATTRLLTGAPPGPEPRAARQSSANRER
jgi:peptidoglycan/xylan/chitin deacetylase (PgdA/CDA1 family)